MISPNIIAKLIKDIKQKQNEVDLNSVDPRFVDRSSVAQPASDPTYSSGFDYARSIAGGMPMSQVIAPGVSYSPEQPMGYTQEQLNTALGTTPVEPEPPQKLPGPGEEGYGQGIGGVTIFDEIFDIKRRPPRDLPPGTKSMFGGDPRDLPIPLSSLPRFNQAEMTKNIARTMRESGMDFTNLFGMPNVNIPTIDKGVGTGGRFIGGPVTVSDTPFTGAGMAGAGARPDLQPPNPTTLNQQNTSSGQPLVPGSAAPTPQTGLTAAELLELSDEELQRYIPRETISQGVGSTRKTYDATPSPEDFRTMLQAQLNPDPNDLLAISMATRLYNPIDTSPQPTQEMDVPVLLPDILGIPAQTTPIIPPMNVPPMNVPPMNVPPMNVPPMNVPPMNVPPMNVPPMNVPPMNVPPVNLPSMVELPPIGGIGKPNQNRFSIQQLPMGLF